MVPSVARKLRDDLDVVEGDVADLGHRRTPWNLRDGAVTTSGGVQVGMMQTETRIVYDLLTPKPSDSAARKGTDADRMAMGELVDLITPSTEEEKRE